MTHKEVLPGSGDEVFQVVFDKVFVKKAPDPDAKSWGWVLEGQMVEVLAARAFDADGREWAELTAAELARSCQCFSKAARGFALLDGRSLGLPQLLRGPLPTNARGPPSSTGDEDDASSCRDASHLPRSVVALRRLSGEEVVVRVNERESVRDLRRHASEAIGVGESRVRLVYQGRVLELSEHAREFWGETVDVMVLAPAPIAVTGSEDRTLCVWDLDDGVCLARLQGHQGKVWALAADFAEGFVLSGADDTSLRLWSLNTLTCIGVLEGHRDAVYSVAADFAGARLAVSGAHNGELFVWDLAARSIRGQLAPPGATGGGVSALAIDAQRSRALSGNEAGELALWDLTSLSRLATLLDPCSTVRAVRAVALDIAAGRALSGSDDGSLRLWDVSDLIECVAFQASPSASHAEGMGMAWALNGVSRAASGGLAGRTRVWNVEGNDLACTKPVRVATPISALAADLHASRAVIGGYDGGLSVRDLGSGVCLLDLAPGGLGHTGTVRAIVAHFG